VYDLETSRIRRPWPAFGRSAIQEEEEEEEEEKLFI